MHKQANPIHVTLPFVRVMIRKRAKEFKFGTHKGKVGRVFNLGKFMLATYPKASARCITNNMRVS
jgi:hypothetical protein